MSEFREGQPPIHIGYCAKCGKEIQPQTDSWEDSWLQLASIVFSGIVGGMLFIYGFIWFMSWIVPLLLWPRMPVP